MAPTALCKARLETIRPITGGARFKPNILMHEEDYQSFRNYKQLQAKRSMAFDYRTKRSK